jgi:hypothetical protein
MVHARAGCGRLNVRDEEDVLDVVQDNSNTRHISSATGRLSRSAVWHTLCENQFYTFHLQPEQGLRPGDKHLRLQFSRWVLHKTVDTPQFLCRVLWTDEVVFTRSDVNNLHNLHVWATESPRATRHSSFQRLDRNCTWQRNRTVCNIGSSRRSAVRRYYWINTSAFIGECTSTCARELMVSIRRCPSPFCTSSKQLAWQQLSGQMDWALRSDRLVSTFSRSDLPPADFYLCGCTKENVYSTKFRDRDDQINSIEVAAAGIVPRQIVSVRGSIRRRCEACVQAEGGHFKHLSWLCTVHSAPWQVPTTLTEKYSKRSTLKWRLKKMI